jgi:hypothetical protein
MTGYHGVDCLKGSEQGLSGPATHAIHNLSFLLSCKISVVTFF